MEHNKEYDERYILKIIPKISQWESIPYAPDLTCQECRKPHHYVKHGNLKATIVGWCECDYGYQLVFECPYCFSKFRFHPHDNKFDIDDFVDRKHGRQKIVYDHPLLENILKDIPEHNWSKVRSRRAKVNLA